MVLTLGIVFLTACGDDSSNKSGNKFTGSRSDINAAKRLVHEYQDSYVYFEKGYISYNKVRENLAMAQTYANFAEQYQSLPTAYYSMRHVGCIATDGSTLPSQQDRHTQMDVVIGERSTRAVYVQQNSLGRCYLGRIGFGFNLNFNGQNLGSGSQSRGVFGLPTDVCQDYVIDEAMVRITKDKFTSNNSSNTSPYNNYWNTGYRWTPDKDYYYEVKNNRFGVFSRNNIVGDSAEDSFGIIASNEAVFVTKTLRSQSTSPSCDKDVYWGFKVDPQNPPEIQILGRN